MHTQHWIKYLVSALPLSFRRRLPCQFFFAIRALPHANTTRIKFFVPGRLSGSFKNSPWLRILSFFYSVPFSLFGLCMHVISVLKPLPEVRPVRVFAMLRIEEALLCRSGNMQNITTRTTTTTRLLRVHEPPCQGVSVKDPLRGEGDRPRPSPGPRAGVLPAVSPVVRLGSGRGARGLQQSWRQGCRVRNKH